MANKLPPIYLQFNSYQEAFEVLTSNGFNCADEFASSFDKGTAFGSCFPWIGKTEYFCNIYNYSGTEFDDIKLPPPLTPYGVSA